MKKECTFKSSCQSCTRKSNFKECIKYQNKKERNEKAWEEIKKDIEEVENGSD